MSPPFSAMPDQEAGDLVRAGDRPPGRRGLAAAVADQDDVRGEGGQERLDVAAGDGREEPLGHLRCACRSVSNRGLPGVHVLAGAVGHLPDGGLAAVQRRGDLGDRHPEDLAEHEDRPLGRGQRLQHDEQGQRDLLAQLGGVLGLGAAAEAPARPVSSGSGSHGPT